MKYKKAQIQKKIQKDKNKARMSLALYSGV